MDLDEVDIYNPDTFVPGVPHEMFAALRREAPVHWIEHDGTGSWTVTSHDDIVRVNRDAKTFSSWQGSALLNEMEPDQLEQQRMMMLNLDPPDHTKLRLIVNKAFTPRRIGDLMDRLRARAQQIVAEVAERGECDFVTDVAAELPLQAIAELLGVPQEDRHRVFDWSNRMIGAEDPEYGITPEESGEAAMELFEYAQSLADDKRKHPGDDIVTTLLEAEVEGHRLTDLDFNLFFMLLAVAGNETTRNAIAHSMLALIEHPAERQKLLDDPSRIGGAVEEFLRWATPVMSFRRTATRDVELGGQKIREGDRVVMWHMSGNRDEAVFDDPYRFDIDRDPNLHLMQIAFGGGGPHFCLGANLARAEMQIMFSELLPVLPDMELAGPVERLRSNFINGIKHMPVSYTAVGPNRP
ncbi:MAG: cytochrome [Acidimicrobiales bacterium]|nr:cytochrome [Acidimicrobiales bacterium]